MADQDFTVSSHYSGTPGSRSTPSDLHLGAGSIGHLPPDPAGAPVPPNFKLTSAAQVIYESKRHRSSGGIPDDGNENHGRLLQLSRDFAITLCVCP